MTDATPEPNIKTLRYGGGSLYYKDSRKLLVYDTDDLDDWLAENRVMADE